MNRARIPILVVDTDPQVHEAVSACLAGGFDVHSTRSLLEAAPLVELRRPRVVLLSTEFDPVELLIFGRFVRTEFRGTIVLGAARQGQARDVTRAMDLGACGVVEKPIDAGRLLTTLAKHFG